MPTTFRGWAPTICAHPPRSASSSAKAEAAPPSAALQALLNLLAVVNLPDTRRGSMPSFFMRAIRVVRLRLHAYCRPRALPLIPISGFQDTGRSHPVHSLRIYQP